MGADLLEVDWSQTSVGPPEEWPTSLTSAVATVLGSRFSMWMAWGPELTFFCNDAYRRDTLGTKYPWALGQPANEVWSEIWDEIGPRIESVLRTGEATWDETLMLFLERSGYKEETYHTFSYSPLTDEAGEMRGILCVVAEETDRVVSERQLATLRVLATETATALTEDEFLVASVESLATNQRSLPFSLIYRFDDDGNAELAACSGIAAGDPGAPLRIEAGDESLWPTAAAFDCEPLTIDDLNERFEKLPTGAWDDPPTTARVVPLLSQSGERPFGFFAAGTNPYHLIDEGLVRLTQLIARHISSGIAGTRALETERQRAQQLAELDRAKTEFFTNVSHELRTPLTLMLAPAEDALTDGETPLPPAQRKRLEVISRNAQRLLKLVNELLDFSRADSAVSGRYARFDLAELTGEVLAMFEAGAAQAGLEFSYEHDALADDFYVDPEMWTKVVSNLLSNAFKFTLDGGVSVRLESAQLENGDGAARLSVTDTGSGVAESEHAKLFERFHRVSGAQARSHEGSGVGLALVAELVARHGGRVEVQSRPGEGSTFSVTIPAGRDHLPADQVVDRQGAPVGALAAEYAREVASWLDDAEPPEPAYGAGDRLNLLVVDDNPDMREYLRSLLSGQYAVTVATNGEEALAIAQRRLPDLVITDVMMPKLDGFGLLAALREGPTTMHVPVIMVSARAGEEGVVTGLEAGADDYLVKPFTARELMARVGSTLELDRTRRAGDELARRQVLLDQAQRLAHIGSWEFDMATGDVAATEETLRIIGVSREELIENGARRVIDKRVHPEDRDAVRRAAQVALSGEQAEFEIRLIVEDQTVLVKVVGELVAESEGGKLLRGSVQDVTEARRIQRELADALAEREASARERAIADQLQRSLLPAQMFDSGDLEVATFYRAGVEGTQVGGDWFDVIDLGGGRTVLVIGDVMGRGVTAASAMGQLRTVVRAYTRLDLEPGEVVQRLSDVVADFTDDQLVTLIYGVHDAHAGTFTYVNAGHLPPVLLGTDGARALATAGGPPIAVGIDIERVAITVDLPADSTLVLYTDGLVERRDADLGEQLEALVRAVGESDVSFEDLPALLVDRMDAVAVDDDIAVLTAHVPETPGGGSRFAETTISFAPAGVREARRFLRNTLHNWNVSRESIPDVTLLVSELVSNAVVHGQGPGRMTLRLRSGVLTVEVADGSEKPPVKSEDESLERSSGRGLQLVDTVAADWGAKRVGSGKVVWFSVSVEMTSA